MKYNINNTIRRTAQLTLAVSLSLTSCTDTWNDHFDESRSDATQTINQLIKGNSDLSDFMKVCNATHVYSNMRPTSVTYADLIASDQALTVWAPVNGTFNVDSLLDLCATAQGDSTVGVHFVSNHISHNIYNMNSATSDNVKMLNDKFLELTPTALYNSKVIENRYNLPATNGLLHVVDDDAFYTYNVYEGLTSLPEYEHIGAFFKHFQQEKLDEDRSIQSDFVDGKKVYSDSVMYTDNILFKRFDYINSEDSSFLSLIPTKELWEREMANAKELFNYGSINKADSIQNYWVNVSLMSDLFFNLHSTVNPSIEDSITSTSYSSADYPQHVYYHPNSPDSLFDKCKIQDKRRCSNGEIRTITEWPFEQTKLYFRPVVMEAELQTNASSKNVDQLKKLDTTNPGASGNSLLRISPKGSTNWEVTFDVTNTLSGTYEVCAVILPKTVYQSNSRDKKPNKFHAAVSVTDAGGNSNTIRFDDDLITSGTKVDTMVIGQVDVPVCSYMQPQGNVKVTLICNVGTREPTYSRVMELDCLLLRPVTKKKNEN